MADLKKQLPNLLEFDETLPSPGMPDFELRLLRRDFAELVAEGFLQDSPEAAEDFIGGYLWFEGLRRQRGE